MLLARLAGAIALVAIVVAIGVSLHEPRGTIVIQAPGPTNQDDDNGGTFLPDGGTFLQGEGPFTGQPRVNPPPVRNAGSRDFPGWRLPSLFPSWDEVRGFLVPRAPACDDRHDMPKLFRSEAFIARYPRTADSSTSPDTVIVGDAIPLCVPRDIAVGPEGELYVLDFYRRPSDDVPGARALVTVYDGDGDRDNEPIRVFSVAADAIAIAVDSTGHFWISSRSAGGVVRVYGPGVKGQTEPARRIAAGARRHPRFSGSEWTVEATATSSPATRSSCIRRVPETTMCRSGGSAGRIRSSGARRTSRSVLATRCMCSMRSGPGAATVDACPRKRKSP
jgi:hypothetical protein